MAARVPAADLNQHLSSPFTALRCRSPGDEAPARIASRTLPRRARSTSTRVLCRGAGLRRRRSQEENKEGTAAARGRERAPAGAGPHTPATLRRRGRHPGRVPGPAGARRRQHHADAGRLRARCSSPAPCRIHGQSEYSRAVERPYVLLLLQRSDSLSVEEFVADPCAYALVQPSVTTDEIDRAVHQMIVDAGAYPSPLGYGGFPKSVCTSVNECTCHGIPDSRELQDGDIINIDVTVYLNGYHGDTSRTYLCGEVDDATKQLVKVTEECMMRGISACKHGASFKEIGQRISEHAEKYGYGIDPFIGHGVGKIFHCEPIIWHTYDYEPGFMVAGQTFTIEPTLSMGSTQCVVWDDGWTAVAVDGSLSAQFEHTVLVTTDGAEILTGFP